MIFRQLFDSTSSTYTYLLGCNTTLDAVVIDSVYEQHARDSALIRELGLKVRYALDTHVHADHVTGAWLMREALGAETVLSSRYGAQNVDLSVDHGDILTFGHCSLTVTATPGHTNGCLTYVTDKQDIAFTGDCLMIRGAGRTDFQAGDEQVMWHSIRDRIFNLPDHCLIYPGHDYHGRTVSTVLEEKLFNPRIGGDARQEDFVGYMENLGLPHPKLIDIAVPANMKGGQPEDHQMPKENTWGPIVMTFAGIPEIQPDWVALHRKKLFVLDVRGRGEFDGELGHLEDAHLIPLDELAERMDEVPKDKPIVALCQSGKRSARATEMLIKADYPKVANIAGGMLQWSRLSLPLKKH